MIHRSTTVEATTSDVKQQDQNLLLGPGRDWQPSTVTMPKTGSEPRLDDSTTSRFGQKRKHFDWCTEDHELHVMRTRTSSVISSSTSALLIEHDIHASNRHAETENIDNLYNNGDTGGDARRIHHQAAATKERCSGQELTIP